MAFSSVVYYITVSVSGDMESTEVEAFVASWWRSLISSKVGFHALLDSLLPRSLATRREIVAGSLRPFACEARSSPEGESTSINTYTGVSCN